ncbi:LytTR family DNA-binding domain-containing protein [Lysobacter humi (ex Lee et al. 2017)]
MDHQTPSPLVRDDASDTLWTRYRPWRRSVEWGFWIASYVIGAVANSVTALMDIRRSGLDFAAWEPAVWEWTSHLVALALLPAVLAFTRRFPLHFDTWRRHLPWLLLGSVLWSLAHVAGMVALRKAIYATQGDVYDPGPWGGVFVYEYLKDVRQFAGIVLTIELYRLLLRRLQGEASLLATPDGTAAPALPERPERFLVRKLGKEFLVAAADVEWLQAAGNYVNLRVRGRDYPLRTTMAAIGSQLDPARFVRVHRSYIVNLDCVVEIEPLDTGDARIAMRDGTSIPCSRTYRAALRPERVVA